MFKKKYFQFSVDVRCNDESFVTGPILIRCNISKSKLMCQQTLIVERVIQEEFNADVSKLLNVNTRKYVTMTDSVLNIHWLFYFITTLTLLAVFDYYNFYYMQQLKNIISNKHSKNIT